MRAPLEAFLQDLRYAIRGLRGKPGFTLAVVITLGLGIGANSAMFSIVDRMLFRPPPMLRDPALSHRIYLASTYRGMELHSSFVQFARYVDLTDFTRSFSRTSEFTQRKLAFGIGTEATEMSVGVVSASFFEFFDAPPALGRYFTVAEDAPDQGAPVAVLSYGYWQTKYGGRTDALGETVRIGSTAYTVIGVTPRGFVGLWPNEPPAAFVPMSAYGRELSAGMRQMGQTWNTTYHWTWAEMMAQRKPDVTIDAATADLTHALLQSYQKEAASDPRMQPIALSKPHGIIASILSDRGPDESKLAKVVTWISGVALIVWLIACANVANLLLARALRRRREVAVRLALGVSWGRLASQLLTESVALALLGGVAGAAVAQWGGALLRALFLSKTTTATVIGDPRALVFTGLAAVMAGLLTGLAPLLQTNRVDLTRDLKSGAREGTYHGSGIRTGLLVLQGTLSVLLLIGAGLFVRSLSKVRGTPLGYDAVHVTTVNLNLRGVALDSTRSHTLLLTLLDAAKRLPGVQHAAIQVTMPFWSTWSSELHVAGIDTVRKLGEFDLNAVTPDYFATMGTRIVRGRGIADEDRAGAPRSMVVSEAMAAKLWPHAEALGQCVKVGADSMPCSYVVGIAENIKASSLNDDPGLYYYLSWDQAARDQGGLFIRTAGNAAQATESLRRALQPLMPGAAYVSLTPLTDVLGSQTESWQLGATMFLAFGVLALVLAAVGLYSVIGYNVAQRMHEMGVRVALGAEVRDLIRLVVRQGVAVASIGIVLGAVIALAAGQWVKPLLFDESPRDPIVFGLVTVTLLSVATIASLIPARRAAKVDPMTALRTD